MTRNLRGLVVAAASVIGGIAATGCGDSGGPLGNLAEQCGLTCPAEGVAEGNASISGVASVDAFFGAVTTFDAKANLVAGNIQAELDAIAVSLDLEPGAASADITAAIKAKIKANVQGDLKVKAEPAKCEVSASATVEATAKCDASVEPGMVSAKCEGTCQVDASAEASCSGDAEVQCTGTAPDLSCSGECKGTCELDTAGSCDGTCEGTCMGGTKDASGRCDGMCQGSCKLEAGGSCSGTCKGECTYTPPSGMCEANATVECKAMADASVECSGKCEGKVEPPKASAECEASAKAEAEANVECTPPSIDIGFEFAGSVQGDATAQAEFEAWLTGFKGHLSAILAEVKRAQVLVDVGGDVAAAANGAVKGAINTQAKGDLDLKATVGLGCALDQLPVVVTVVGDATSNLQASLSGAVDVTGAVGLK